MTKANLHEAKTNLSKLVELVLKGEEVIICKAGMPVAKLVPFRLTKKVRKPGAWQGKVIIEDDFEKLPADFLEYFK